MALDLVALSHGGLKSEEIGPKLLVGSSTLGLAPRGRMGANAQRLACWYLLLVVLEMLLL